MKEFWENLKDSCTNAKIFLVTRPLGFAIMCWMLYHFWSQGISTLWNLFGVAYCAVVGFEMLRGYLSVVLRICDEEIDILEIL